MSASDAERRRTKAVTDLEWPRAKVRDRAGASALGWPAILGVILFGLAVYRGNVFQAIGAACVFALGVAQLRRAHLIALPFRDARLFVRGGTLTIDGLRIDVERVLRSETKDAPLVVIDARRGPSVTVQCATTEERRALLVALGASPAAPHVFMYAPWFTRPLFMVAYLVLVATVIAKVFHVMPVQIGWQPLWLLNVGLLGLAVPWRLEITKDEVRFHRTIVPLRGIRSVQFEASNLSRIPTWLIIDHETVDATKVLIIGGLAQRAADVVEKSAKRAQSRAGR